MRLFIAGFTGMPARMAISTIICDDVTDKSVTVLGDVSSRDAFPLTSVLPLSLHGSALVTLEGDIMEGGRGAGGLATHVERRCRYLLAAKLTNKKAETMTQQSIKFFLRTPIVLRKTLTVDNGKEFSHFK